MREREKTREQVRGRLVKGLSQTEKLGVSIFVNNLPTELDKYGLRGIFNKIGRVVDSYIPMGSRNQSMAL